MQKKCPATGTAKYFDNAVHDLANGDHDLDATWNAIMQKKCPATARALSSSSKTPSSSSMDCEPLVGAVELGRRSDDFIKKIHRSFGPNQ
jgi:hypothetical protein